MKFRYAIFIISLLLFSCAKEQPKVAWLKIGKWVLKDNPDAQYPEGALTQNLNQVFVSVDGKSLGAYEVPAKIPIIAKSGKHEIVLLPGVENNGIHDTKKRYPFVKKMDTTINLIQNDTVSIIPTTQYYSNLKFLVEDFESPSMKIEVGAGATAALVRENDPANLKWGNYYGAVHLTNQDSLISFTTLFNESFPKGAAEVYLELDYKNTNSALTSLISYGNGTYYDDPYIQLNPQSGTTVWKHIYIDLKEDVSYRLTSPNNEVEFTIYLDKGKTSTYFYLDNLKIIFAK